MNSIFWFRDSHIHIFFQVEEITKRAHTNMELFIKIFIHLIHITHAYLSNVFNCINVCNVFHMTTRWKSMGCVQIHSLPLSHSTRIVYAAFICSYFFLFIVDTMMTSMQIHGYAVFWLHVYIMQYNIPADANRKHCLFYPIIRFVSMKLFGITLLTLVFVKLQWHHNDVKQYC